MKMLCTRHLCYHLFHDNKPSSKIFSKWLVFGNQFMQIQNINSNCNIPIQPQQLQYERCQFYTRIYTNDHLSSPYNHLDLESQFLWLDPFKRRNVRLRISRGKSGNKYFRITTYKYGKYDDFTSILVPQDAYSFVRALDELIMELAGENFEQKLKIQDFQSAIKIAKDAHQTLKSVEFTGLFHKFQLELWFFPKMDKDKMNDQMQSSSLSLGLIAFHKISMKKITRNLNLKALPWLRKQMAEMLEKYDGTEEIEKEAPAQIPEQFFNLGNTNVLLPNCISSSAHSFEDKRMRQPQFVKKKPASFQQYPKMPTKMQNFNEDGHKKQMPFGMQGKPNLQRPKVKKPNKNGIEEPVDPQMAKLEEHIRALFQFDDEEMNKYRRTAAKTKKSINTLILQK